MSYEFYKIVHLIGIFLLLFTTGGLVIGIHNKGDKNFPAYKKLAAGQGISLLLLLIAGFGLMARLNLSPLPLWVILKLVIWLLFAFSLTLLKKNPKNLLPTIGLISFLALSAILLAILKPF